MCNVSTCLQADAFGDLYALLNEITPESGLAKRTSDVRHGGRNIMFGFRCNMGNISKDVCECFTRWLSAQSCHEYCAYQASD